MSRIGASKARERRALAVAPATPATVARPEFGRQVPPPSATRWVQYAQGELSFGQVVAIQRQAERGFTEQWADLTRRMLADDHLASVRETRIDAVAGARYEIKPGVARPGQERAAQLAADDCAAVLDGLGDVEDLLGKLLDGVGVGWAYAEIIWEPRGDLVWPVAVEWLHPRRFRFDDRFRPTLWDDGAAMGYPGASKETIGRPLAPNKYIRAELGPLHNYLPASGLFWASVRYWWLKSWAQKFWLSGAEVAGNPRYIGQYPQEASDVAKQALFDALEGLSGDGIGVMSKDTAIQILSPLAQGSTSVWHELVRQCNAGLSKVWLGSTLNVEVGDTGGNRALGESQADLTTMPRLRRDARALWTTIERDLFTPFLRFNAHRYGGMPPVPRGESVLLEEERPTVDDLTVDVGAATRDEVRESRGLEPWGPERGGTEIAVRAAPAGGPDAGFPFSASPQTQLRRAPRAALVSSGPRAPWLTAAMIAGSDVTQTSGPSPTTASASARSRR